MASALIIYGIFMLFIITAGVVFGIRSGQFKNKENANRLPLDVDDVTNNKNKN